ncbi:unnamed protein product [Phytomonas sp. Hart1]|nr:unnamed protein product [Phytomonas sp. Hart1]|eukprot:CCW66564.1 unnamed protein product [Phytomonas sp. isolate Hart1]
MENFTLNALYRNLVLVLLLFNPFVAHHATAKTIVVLDVDGMPNNYAALTTLLKHPEFENNLQLVTVSGATYGYASTVVQNFCNFLSFAGHPLVTVAMGQVSALEDVYNTKTQTGDCIHKQGFPATPHDALLRGMMYSKADVTSAFGQTYRLPFTALRSERCVYSIGSATKRFLKLLGQSTDKDKIAYLQLGSSTNLAEILDALESSKDLSSLFDTIVQVHAFETGYNGGADEKAISKLLNANRFTLYLYTPVFYAPSLTFNDSTWGLFETITQGESSSKVGRWLFQVLGAKKKHFQLNGGSPTDFYNEYDLASSLMILCIMDETIGNLCKYYRDTVSGIWFAYVLPDDMKGYLPLHISGNNVTMPFYYNIKTATKETDISDTVGDVTLNIYDKSVSTKFPEQDFNLVDKFWEVWLNLMKS